MPRRKSGRQIIDGLKRDLGAYGVQLTRPEGSKGYIADVSPSWDQAQVSRAFGENVSAALAVPSRGVTVGLAVARLERFLLDADEDRRDTESRLKKKYGTGALAKSPALT